MIEANRAATLDVHWQEQDCYPHRRESEGHERDHFRNEGDKNVLLGKPIRRTSRQN